MTRPLAFRLVVPVLLPILAMPVGAQQPAKEKPSGALAPLVTNVDVSVTNLDVIVTDSKGNRVTGLRKEDFEVVEDGLVQSLTNFFALEAGRVTIVGDEPVPAPPAPSVPSAPALPPAVKAPKTRIAIFVDNLHLTPFNRNRILRNVQDFVRTTVKDDVEAMVVTWDRSLKIRRKFTSDGRDLADVLKQVEELSAPGLSTVSERREVIQAIDDAKSEDQAVARVRSYAQSLRNDLEFTIDAMKTTLNQLSGLEGRKILLHVSEGLPQSPGAELWTYITDRFHSGTSGVISQQFEFDRTSGYLGVIQAANAAGVSIYTIDASGLSVDSAVTAENRTNQARLDTFIERGNLQSMLVAMAEETGGQAILNKNDITVALKEVEKDFTSYYSLGYRSIRSGVDRPHKVDVKVKKKGLTVRARRSYLEKGPDTKINEAVVSALYFPREDNPLAVGLEVGSAAPADSQNYHLPVRLRIPYPRITLLPEGSKLRGRLIVYFMVIDASGDKSELATQPVPIELDARSLDSLAKKDHVFDATLLMKPGGHRISVAVRDEPTNVVSYLQKSVFVSVLPPEEKKRN